MVGMAKEKGVHVDRWCGQRAPNELVGSLGPLYCNREVSKKREHGGDHRAHRTIDGVGRVNVLWKQKREMTQPPPVIVLPSISGDTLNARKAYRPEGGRCQCPAHWVGQHLHYPGCPLAR